MVYTVNGWLENATKCLETDALIQNGKEMHHVHNHINACACANVGETVITALLKVQL